MDFKNKIANFYPMGNALPDRLGPTFFFNYSKLPIHTQFLFGITLTGIQFNSDLKIGLIVFKDKSSKDNIIVNQNFAINTEKNIVSSDNFIDDNHFANTISLLVDDIEIDKGNHSYYAIALLTKDNVVLDQSHTTFVTRPFKNQTMSI